MDELERTPPNILDGVIETLDYLAERHRLILFTKGEPAEQAAKVERSGLQIHFDAIEIVPEKDVATYRALVNRHHVVKSHGWMVGNSPRSDINPALEAGFNAVFIPHPATWALEHEEVRSGGGPAAHSVRASAIYANISEYFATHRRATGGNPLAYSSRNR